MLVDFPFAQSSTYPELAKEIRAVFVPESPPAPAVAPASRASSVAAPPHTALSTTNNGLDGVTIQVRSYEDEDKDAAANLGQCKLRLFLASANVNWVTGTVDIVAYPILSGGMKTVLPKARSACADITGSTSILSKLATIHKVQKTMAASKPLRGRYPTRLISVHGSVRHGRGQSSNSGAT